MNELKDKDVVIGNMRIKEAPEWFWYAVFVVLIGAIILGLYLLYNLNATYTEMNHLLKVCDPSTLCKGCLTIN